MTEIDFGMQCTPGLKAIVDRDDLAMPWYEHGVSYSP